jgi:hypothetical protein
MTKIMPNSAPPARHFCADVLLPSTNSTGMLQSMNNPMMNQAQREKLQAAFVKTKVWPQFYNVKIEFLDGTTAQKNLVKQVVLSTFQPHINLKLSFYERNEIPKSDVRVTFNPNIGAWSYMGIDAWSIDQREATLNLGWLDEPPGGNYGVIKHEFGHCLGPWIHVSVHDDSHSRQSDN